ncbi:hypothetical protein T4B_7412 [Trichinella pseudospiralis]|uniref:Uncharacterized protein n=1 Tax=Trichinella pseudospiralis TaxID=6337 RepID=A0A0V1E084_TRIPS|nr:hypothetical protein T4E_10889 [Trichinella pseudospiralis]KRY67164.1 hypothetical protein T4A_13317 [Trichinella pseudospiralis]KRZ08387.1 hypothetical protein T4B_7412 [Trichinella pseudospiralis]KRZ29676.1 hypothetical protein T4C_4159 [Trichinella pseudospiralis]
MKNGGMASVARRIEELEMKIAICQERYSHLDNILRVLVINCMIAVSGNNRKECGKIRQIAETRLSNTRCTRDDVNRNSGRRTKYHKAKSISDPYFALYGTTGIMRTMEIMNEETCASCPRLPITLAHQVLNILSVAEFLRGEEHRRSLFRFMWHNWDYEDESLIAGSFRIFSSLLQTHDENQY